MEIFLNGQFLAADAPCIRVQDRGFRYGDGAFETIPLYGSAPYQWEFHLNRLRDTLAELRIPLDLKDLRGHCDALIARNGAQNALLRIAVSRGEGGRGYLPTADATPTLVIETLPRPAPLPGPLTLWLSAREKISPRALPVHHKLAQGLHSALARLEAADHGCGDALLLNAAGEVCETASANILWLKDGALHTPALSCGVLNGSTRHALLRCSPWPVQEGGYRLDDLQAAEAVAVCNAGLPVSAVAALQPLGRSWRNVAFAQQLADILTQDILRDTLCSPDCLYRAP